MSDTETTRGYEPTKSVQVDVNLRTVIFSGKETEWPEWSFRFKALIAQQGLLEEMLQIGDEDQETEFTVDQARQRSVYYKLATSVQGDASRIIRLRVKEGDGSGAWNALQARYQSGASMRKDRMMTKLF